MKFFKFFLAFLPMALVSCGGFMDGLYSGMGGYGMYSPYGVGTYQVMPGGFVRNTSYDYLLDPRLAIQRVQQQEQQEYMAAKRSRPNLTIEQFRAEKAQLYQNMQSSSASSSSSSNSSSSSFHSSSSGGKTCTHCHGSGRCGTCNGRGYYYNELNLTQTLTCPNCPNHNGICKFCGGSGTR